MGLWALDFRRGSVYNINMKQLCFIFSCIYLCISAVPAFAQGKSVLRGLKSGETAVRRAASSSLRKLPGVKVPAAGGIAGVSGLSRLSAGSRAPSAPSVKAVDVQRMLLLEQSVRNLQKENLHLKATLNHISSRTSLLRATFQAVETAAIPSNPFSGTVFKTVYNGEEEIFGVVAAHAIARSASDRALKRHFTVGMFDGEKVVEFPAEIVQVSSPSMLDIALVKFPPEVEKLFQPLRISEVPVKFGDVLSSQGFAGNTNIHISNRQITKVTPLSVRTTIPFSREERPGLCGSAVVNENHELVGIHTGSVYDRQDEMFDVGYATNASFLNTLVEAYHNGGVAAFPLILNGKKTISLNVDEYISYISFYNAEGKQVWQQGFDSKFSYSKVQEMLDIYSPRYIDITVCRAVWNPEDPSVLFEHHTAAWDRSKTTYKYDFETQQIVSVSKAKKDRK